MRTPAPARSMQARKCNSPCCAGTCLLKSRWLLFQYGLYSRMLEDAYQDRFKRLVSSTIAIGNLYR